MVGQTEAHRATEVVSSGVAPGAAIEPHDMAGGRCKRAVLTAERSRLAGQNRVTMQDGRAIAGMEAGGLHDAAIRTHRQSSRDVGKEREDCEWPTIEAVIESRRVIHPDIGTTPAWFEHRG